MLIKKNVIWFFFYIGSEKFEKISCVVMLFYDMNIF